MIPAIDCSREYGPTRDNGIGQLGVGGPIAKVSSSAVTEDLSAAVTPIFISSNRIEPVDKASTGARFTIEMETEEVLGGSSPAREESIFVGVALSNIPCALQTKLSTSFPAASEGVDTVARVFGRS